VPIVSAKGFTAVTVVEPPRLTDEPLMVTELFVNAELGNPVMVLLLPLIVLLVSVSVVFLPTRVSVEVGSVRRPVLLIDDITGVVSVLFVSVCDPVKVTTVLSIAIVTGDEPL
jgi:hypothetical protein